MIRRPPRSTLFPYTRSSDLRVDAAAVALCLGQRAHQLERIAQPEVQPLPCRSEEHTSELQSRVDLVCRLLLEKKKKQAKIKLSYPCGIAGLDMRSTMTRSPR